MFVSLGNNLSSVKTIYLELRPCRSGKYKYVLQIGILDTIFSYLHCTSFRDHELDYKPWLYQKFSVLTLKGGNPPHVDGYCIHHNLYRRSGPKQILSKTDERQLEWLRSQCLYTLKIKDKFGREDSGRSCGDRHTVGL